MIRVVFILVLVFLDNQERENFGDFYFNKFTVDPDFKKTRIKYPLTITDFGGKKIELKTWEQRIDTLLVDPKEAIFITQSDMMLVMDNTTTLQNTFKKIDGHWFLTELTKLK